MKFNKTTVVKSRGGKSKKGLSADSSLTDFSTLTYISNFIIFKGSEAISKSFSAFFILLTLKCESNIFFPQKDGK